MIRPINYTDVATMQVVFHGSVAAGQQNVVVGPATWQFQRNIFIINFCFTFWGAKASGLSIGEGTYAYLAIDGMDLNSAALLAGGEQKKWAAAIHHNGREIDVFRRVQAGNNMVANANLVLDANSVGTSTVELIASMFYFMED